MKCLPGASLAAATLALLAFASPARAERETLDKGTLTVRLGTRTLGVEAFTFERSEDSLIVRAEVYQTRDGAAGTDTLHKRMTLIMSASEHSLHQYQSLQEARGHVWGRSVVQRDSTLSSARQVDERGEVNVLRLPPGRVFVMDGGMFTLFDVICRWLAERSFDRRPVNVVTLGVRDSVFEVMVRDGGHETLRWGGKPVQARRLEFEDKTIHYTAWVGPDGHMLRLLQPDIEMRVERESPAIKPRAQRPREP